MNDAALVAMAALSTTSVLVRIVPAFVRLSLGERGCTWSDR